MFRLAGVIIECQLLAPYGAQYLPWLEDAHPVHLVPFLYSTAVLNPSKIAFFGEKGETIFLTAQVVK